MNKKNVFEMIVFYSVFLSFVLLSVEFVSACNVKYGTYADGCWDRDYGECCGWIFRGFLFDNNKACAVGGPSTCPYPYSDYQTYSSAIINKCPSGNDGDSCDVKAGWYCDTGFSGSWDASENKCVLCSNGIETKIYGDSLSIYTDEGGINGNSKCESGCPNVDKICDEKSPGTFLNSCVYGKTYFADQCSASCQVADEKICRSSAYYPDCTASPECNGVAPGSNVAGGSCDNNCKFVKYVSIMMPIPETTTTVLPCNIDNTNARIWCSDSCRPMGYRYIYCTCDQGTTVCNINKYYCSNSATNGGYPTSDCNTFLTTTIISTTTTIPPNCKILLDKYSAAYGATCTDSKWTQNNNYVADVNRDKKIDTRDGGLIGQNAGNDAWCLDKLNLPDSCLSSTTTTSQSSSTTTTVPTIPINCQSLIDRWTAANGAVCGGSKWDGVVDINRDRVIDIKDIQLIEQNRYNDAWCLQKLNQPDSCNLLRVEAKIDFLQNPPSLSGLRIDIDGVATYTDGGSVTLYPSSGDHNIRAYNFGMREFSHSFDSDCNGNGNYLDIKTNPYGFTMYEKSRTITLFYKVLTQIANLNYDGTKITGKLLGEDNNPIIERGSSHPSCSDPNTGTVYIHPNRNVDLYYSYDGVSWNYNGSVESSLTDGSFSYAWICPAGVTKIKAVYKPTNENWFYSGITIEKDVSCGAVITSTTTTVPGGTTTTTTVPPTGCIELIGYSAESKGFTVYCSLPGGICQQGDGIQGLLKMNMLNPCANTPQVTIEMKDSGCDKTYTFSASRYYCSGAAFCGYEFSWAFPELPTECLGKTVMITVSSEGASASKTGIKLSNDARRDEKPSMNRMGDWSPSIIFPTDQVSYTSYADDDKGLKEIQIQSLTSNGWQVVKSCPVSGTSASCQYTSGPYSLGTSICLRGNATDIKNQVPIPDFLGTKADCRDVCNPPSETDGGKNYNVKGNCTSVNEGSSGCGSSIDSDFCPFDGPKGYCCNALPGQYWSVSSVSDDGTTVCCRRNSPLRSGSCDETKTINCKNVLAESYINGRECAIEFYDCSSQGKICSNGICVTGITTTTSTIVLTTTSTTRQTTTTVITTTSTIPITSSTSTTSSPTTSTIVTTLLTTSTTTIRPTTTTTTSPTTSTTRQTTTTTSSPTTSTIVTTTSTVPITTTTVPPGAENCCANGDEDNDQKANGADPECQNNVDLTAGTNNVCWWTEWDDYSNNADYYSGWFTCPPDYIVGVVTIEQYTEQNYDFFTIYDGNNNVRYNDSGEDGLKTIDMSSFNTAKIKFRFTSDSTARRDGVKVNSIVCSIPGGTTSTSTIPTTTTSTISATTVITTSTTTPITSTTTGSTTTTIIPEFVCTDFTCNSMSNGYKCQFSYTNNLVEDTYVMFLFSDSTGEILPCATLMKTQRGTGTVETIFLCPRTTGRYYVDWLVYLASDTRLKNPIRWSTPWSTPCGTKELVC